MSQERIEELKKLHEMSSPEMEKFLKSITATLKNKSTKDMVWILRGIPNVVQGYHSVIDELFEEIDRIEAELTKEREANKKLLSGLEWYGNELRYYMPTELLNDNGRRARYIISSVQGGNEPNEG
ncbi:hypothetical protein OB236_38430 [Paenibacillus sp. WQ 127069]|uniref:Uncharacterized protein n=1 Tax=Paenibacillus baimaensis TaxID=2982185 RepID=A0ABT2UTP5_9BACL|nr:hypothetical protein [Paenibacillus sp. WQ 127069]MCU6798019.1 hypothetical protein [Paenibacillus sp. WQ 127069]